MVLTTSIGHSISNSVPAGTIGIYVGPGREDNHIVLVPEKYNFIGALNKRHHALIGYGGIKKAPNQLGDKFIVFGNKCEIVKVDDFGHTDYKLKLKFDNGEVLWTTLDGKLHNWMQFSVLEEDNA